MCGISDVYYYSQDFIFWPATKVKSKHKTVVCDHGEDTTKLMVTRITKKILSVLCCWKIAASTQKYLFPLFFYVIFLYILYFYIK